MGKISLLILAKDEERNIVDCINSAKEAVDEIIVIDDYSQDATRALAESLGAKVFQRRLDGFANQFNYAHDMAEGDFVFYLDADERFSPGLKEHIHRHIKEHPKAVGRVKRRNVAFGVKHYFGPLKPDWVPRLFPKNSIKWKGLVHPFPEFALESKKLSGHLIHFTYRDWDHYLNKMRHYAELWADDKFKQGQMVSQPGIILRLAFNLFKMLVLNGGILGGPICWFLCYFNGSYTLSKYLKLKEKGDGAGL